jgi:drug/metabolite transporter (DMT)-like permease
VSLSILLVVLASAVAHASWNAWVKSTGHARLAMALISAAWCLFALAFAPWLPALAPASWPYLIASAIVHIGYLLGLSRLYARSDLSRAYVLLRALPPAVVTIASVVVLHEHLGLAKGVSVFVVVLGVLLVAPPTRAVWEKNTLIALVLTVGTIATYTLIDGVGARKSGDAKSYGVLLGATQGAMYLAIIGVREGRALLDFAKLRWKGGLVAGLASMTAYTSVLWSMTHAPLGVVAAVRETSVLVAAFFGGALLGERVPRGAYVGALLVTLGIAGLQLTG